MNVSNPKHHSTSMVEIPMEKCKFSNKETVGKECDSLLNLEL